MRKVKVVVVVVVVVIVRSSRWHFSMPGLVWFIIKIFLRDSLFKITVTYNKMATANMAENVTTGPFGRPT